jgi:aminoglycoside 6'-N-acetyltransferase I
MTSQGVELRLSDEEDAYIIRNLWPLYLHDVSEFDGCRPNRHGIVSGDDSLATFVRLQERWWRNPAALFPYLILVDGCPAGFNLIAARAGVPAGIEADFVVHEFFVLHAFRGRGVAERAAREGFDRHRGEWEVVTYPSHARAIAFWRRVVSKHSAGDYSEDELDHPWGRKVAFRFGNARGPSGRAEE